MSELINIDFAIVTDFVENYDSEEKCIEQLEILRWNGNVVSPFDSKSKVYKCKRGYKCKNTGKYFNVKTGTMFDGTKVKLLKWFYAIHYMTLNQKASSYELSRKIAVTQRTCYSMITKMRNANLI